MLRQNIQGLAAAAERRYFDRHPELRAWKPRVKPMWEDTAFTLKVLASSIDVQSTAAFENHIRWLASAMRSRNLDLVIITESLDDIRAVLEDEAPEVLPAALPRWQSPASVRPDSSSPRRVDRIDSRAAVVVGLPLTIADKSELQKRVQVLLQRKNLHQRIGEARMNI